MAKICQLHADLRYYLCMEPVDMRKQFQDMHEQLAGVTSRLDRTERELDLERATREDIIKAEVERRVREAEQRIREKVE